MPEMNLAGDLIEMPNTIDEAKMIEMLVNAINEATATGLKVTEVDVRWSTTARLYGRTLDIRATFG